jgi:DNA-binding CsgD family transcriptional regulator
MRRGRPPYPDVLTPREWEVLSLLREGLTNKQISARLGISERGAKYHVAEILSKLGMSGREEAVAWRQRPLRRFPLLAAIVARFHDTPAHLATGLLAFAVLSLFALALGTAVMERRGGRDKTAATQQQVTEELAAQRGRPHGRFDLAPFDMTRVVTTAAGHEAVFHLHWESEERWKETLVSTNSPVPAFAQHDPAGFLNLGSYQEAIDGKLIRFDMVRECLTCPVGRRLELGASGDATLIPGVWFWQLDALIRTRKQAEVFETETEVTVRVTTPVATEEWVFDKRTRIPVAYRTMGPDGAPGTESLAMSVVLLSGETVR